MAKRHERYNTVRPRARRYAERESDVEGKEETTSETTVASEGDGDIVILRATVDVG